MTMTPPPTPRSLLCEDCGHHLHRPNPGHCQWRDCPCEAVPMTPPPAAAALAAALADDDGFIDACGLVSEGHRDVPWLLERIAKRLAASGWQVTPSENDERIREALWRGHGHDFIYGDDGEMQCNWTEHPTDFKRATMRRLLEHCDLARLMAVTREGEGQ